tara:strand:+ start:100323 stop:100952 length:630 start_codon:yes stop_codon:yes gene_type:complete
VAKDGSITRNGIIDTAMSLALQQGLVGTSIDEVIDAAGITKGTFYYHFSSKKDLAKILIEKFSSMEIDILEQNMDLAIHSSNDPLQQLIKFVQLIQELHKQIDKKHIGCLFASYSYENQLIDKHFNKIATDTIKAWNKCLSEKIEEIVKKYPPRFSIDPEKLAEMFLVTLEGAYVLERVTDCPGLVQAHLEQYKIYLQALFQSNNNTDK